MAQAVEFLKSGVRMLEKEIDRAVAQEKAIGSGEEGRKEVDDK